MNHFVDRKPSDEIDEKTDEENVFIVVNVSDKNKSGKKVVIIRSDI